MASVMALAQILTALYLDYSNAPSLSRAPPKGSSPGGGLLCHALVRRLQELLLSYRVYVEVFITAGKPA